MKKASRNKTIDMPLAEGQEFLSRCLYGVDGTLPTDKCIIGDSFEIMRQLPTESFDLIIADPPYNLRREFGESTFSKMSLTEYEEYTREWLSLAAPLLKKSGSIYVCCDYESSLAVGRVLSEFFTVRNRITWEREKGRGAKKNWKNSMEDVWFATASDDYTFNLDAVKVRRRVLAPYREDGKPKDWVDTEDGKYRDTCPSNFWDDITVPFWSMPENTDHPTQKPEKLLAKLILASSNPGDMVFDPFGGSGTTAVTAQKLNRRFCTIEMNEEYCCWAAARLEKARTDQRIQGYEDGVFWERNSRIKQ